MKKAKTEFYVPIFQGFYESIHSWQLDSAKEMEIENISEDLGLDDYDYDNFNEDYDVDYEAMYVEYAKAFADNFKDEFAEELKEETWIEILDFKELYSPNQIDNIFFIAIGKLKFIFNFYYYEKNYKWSKTSFPFLRGLQKK